MSWRRRLREVVHSSLTGHGPHTLAGKVMTIVSVLSDGQRLTGAYALGPEAGEWLQQATLAIRAHIPLVVLSDTIQTFPSFSGIYDAAVMSLRMRIMDRPRSARPMDAQVASLSA